MNKKLGYQFVPTVKSELWVPSPKRIRAFFNGQLIADSKRTVLLRLFPMRYFFPPEDVNMDWLQANGHSNTGRLGKTNNFTMVAGDRKADNAARQYLELPAVDNVDLKGYFAFDWHSMDDWYEEDEPVTVHPRDPYIRIDTLQSSRHVKIVMAGETIADSKRPVLLYEAGHITRYYLYRTDVRLDLLERSDKHTGCPYKGLASYYSVRVGDEKIEDIIWTYPAPYPECIHIQNMMCFFSEKIDKFYVDGELLNQETGS